MPVDTAQRKARLQTATQILTKLPPLLTRLGSATTADRHIYIAGNGYDFEEFTVPIIKRLDEKLAGVACVWPFECEFENYIGEKLFTLPQSYVEPSTRPDPVLIYCQSLISDLNEIGVALDAIASKIQPSRVLIVCLRITQPVAADLDRLSSSIRIELVSNEVASADIDLRTLKKQAFEKLDDRVVKPGLLMSDWLIERITRPKLDHTPDPAPQPTRPNEPSGRGKTIARDRRDVGYGVSNAPGRAFGT
ncbi:hypothetical protein GOB27_19495 [Sinorhizobium meliloti]|nr:hypothetical protein [Sinorhizobium meliloti]